MRRKIKKGPTEAAVLKMRQRMSVIAIAKHYGVTRQAIYKILWKANSK